MTESGCPAKVSSLCRTPKLFGKEWEDAQTIKEIPTKDKSETGRPQVRSVRFQTAKLVGSLVLSELQVEHSVSFSQPIVCVPKRTHRVSRRTHRLRRRTLRKTQEGCGGLGGEDPGAFPKAAPNCQQPLSLPEVPNLGSDSISRCRKIGE